MFEFTHRIRFSHAKYYSFRPIPLPKPFKDGTGGFGNFAPERGCIELYDSEGACAHLACTGRFVEMILPLILNNETKSFKEWKQSLYWKFRNEGFQSGPAVEVGQLEIMMMDILAQRAGLPLHRFMGAEKDWAAAYKGGGSLLLSDEELVEDMQRYVEEGYRTVKFKVGSDEGTNMGRDVRRLKKVRDALGEEVAIAVDANQRWSVEEACQFGKMIEEYGPAWFEEPIHAHDMNGIRRLHELLPDIQLAFGESMRISYAYETYAEKGVGHLQPSFGRMTRMDDLLRIRDMARDKGIRFSSGGRVYMNASFGCLYGPEEYIEFHEPPTVPVGEYTMFCPEERNGRFYVSKDAPGIAQRMNVEKLEKDGLLQGYEIYRPM
ncbi:enolase C-terminal domain-like protein [Enterocloster citroniae]|uniref:enolase C-terminal domain-like protein n=1 Tax=Enterocloster citroniae TaxID=358743 RepID=UPI001898DEAC|nr:enolase C-terminal domain-like protein [Enterocloster citroniae]